MAHVAPPNPDLPVDDSPEQEYKQPIMPLIVMASALMGVGFYFAVAHSEAKTKYDAKPFEMAPFTHTITSPLQPKPLDKTIVLNWSSSSKATYRMQQQSVRTSKGSEVKPVRADIIFDVERGVAKDNKVPVSLSNARVQMRQGKDAKHVGADIAAQIQTVLNKGKARLSLDKHQSVTDYKWTSSSNPQLRPTLRLVANTQSMLYPRFKKGPLQPGDSWSYDLPWAGKKDDTLKTDAIIRFEHIYKGTTTKDVAIFETKITTSGTINAEANKATVQGSGKGALLINLKSNTVQSFGFTLNQTLVAGDITQKSTMSFETTAK